MTFRFCAVPARLVAAVLVLAPWPPLAGRAWAGEVDGIGVAVRQVVIDIISYTRWPEPRAALRFCVVGPAQYGAAFLEAGLQSGTVPIRAVRLGAGDERAGTDCDVVYEGALVPGERDAVGRRLAVRAVLVVGEPAPGCIEVTMFCLAVRGDQVSFASNLDAIARSGVRLNPRVLLLGRRQGSAR